MAISPIGSLKPVVSVTSLGRVDGGPRVETGESGGTSFKQMVKDAIGEVNSIQNQSDQLAEKLATGEIEDVHQAMIAMQKAKLALDLTIQVRNKVIEAYQEVMRMQV